MIELTDELLLRTAPAARELWLEQATEGVDEAHVFSRRFLRRMNALLRRERRSPRANRALRAARRIAVVLLVLLLCVGTVLAFDAEAREAVAKWFKETFAHSVVYHFTDEENPDTALPNYTLGWVPEGFEMSGESRDELSGYIVMDYQEIDGDGFFSFEYFVMSDSFAVTLFDIDDTTRIEKVDINGTEADYCPANGPDDFCDLSWFDSSNHIAFSVGGNLQKEDILHIARSIHLEESIN